MSTTPSVIVDCCEEDCVEVFLDQVSDNPVILYTAGPPGPIGDQTKSGTVAGADFTGSPKKYLVVFEEAYVDDAYSILISGTDSRSYTYEGKTNEGFTINANAGAVLTGQVSWFTLKNGA